MSKIFKASEFLKKEYACEVVRIGEITPIEGSDFLGKVEIHPGMPVVVRKDLVRRGDVMFYVDVECQLSNKFLSANNQYQDTEMNADPNEKGFFTKNGRVRMVRLRGQESMGYLFSRDAMVKYLDAMGIALNPDKDWPSVGEVFDMVGNDILAQAYVPKVNTPNNGHGNRVGKRNSKLKKFDRMIPGEFSYHYDTDQLEKNIYKIDPNDTVDISIKLHGTSAIFAHIKTKRKLKWFEKIMRLIGMNIPTTEYSHIYSSRTVIKNQYINEKADQGYYNENVWAYWNDIISKYIPEGYTVYGEIIGFTPKGQAIQKAGNAFDYGCGPNESHFMIYRISNVMDDGKRYEWNVEEVRQWTEHLKDHMKKIGDGNYKLLRPIDTVFHGTLCQLYPDIEVTDHWHEDVLHALASDKRFHMEENEPFCKNKVPREGLVIRKFNDPLREAFKLKTFKFRNKEAKAIDDGQVDIEMEQAY